MAWADDKLFAFLETLPREAWLAKAGENEWDVVHLTFHLVASADWYRYQLGGQLKLTAEPESIAEVQALRSTWREIDAFLVEQSDQEDGLVSWTEEGRTDSALRSIVLTQAIVHSVEHRTQIMSALRSANMQTPDLEDFSAWAYPNA